MGAVIGAIFGIILTAGMIAIILGGVFMLIGAKISKIKNVTWGKAILVSIVCAVSEAVISSVIFIVTPSLVAMLIFFVNLLVQLFIIKSMFNTDVGKAFLLWIFNLVAQIVAIIITFMIFGIGLASLVS